MVRVLINATFSDAALIEGRHLSEGGIFSDLSVERCALY